MVDLPGVAPKERLIDDLPTGRDRDAQVPDQRRQRRTDVAFFLLIPAPASPAITRNDLPPDLADPLADDARFVGVHLCTFIHRGRPLAAAPRRFAWEWWTSMRVRSPGYRRVPRIRRVARGRGGGAGPVVAEPDADNSDTGHCRHRRVRLPVLATADRRYREQPICDYGIDEAAKSGFQ